MGYNIGPKIGIDGEKEFREQIRNINSEYKTLDAQTRALTAAFEAQGDEQGKLRVKAEQLDKQVETLRKKEDLLKDAVAKASTQFGDNSQEANRLKGALYDTQASISKLETESKDAKTQLAALEKGMEAVGDEAESASEDLSDFGDILKGSLAADLISDGLDKAVDALMELGEGSLDAAADVRAANAQFSQTFGDLEATAKSALETVSQKTNIAVSRMQESYTKLYAFTKTAGAESSEAMDIAQRAMAAAADSAAYYDKSIEEAAESLQSFLKGNYANDAALGISATETARNTAANEKYAVSFQELSESQKIDVLLSMVEAGNAASGALGQAAAEADAWANVNGELQESVKQLQAAIGEPALEFLIPIIQGITGAINDLTKKTEAQILRDRVNDFAAAMEGANKKVADTTDEVNTSAQIASSYAERLKSLEDAGLDTAESQQEYVAVVKNLNTLIPTLNLEIDDQTGLLKKSTSSVLANIEAWKKQVLAQATMEAMTEKVKAAAQAEKALESAIAEQIKLEEEAVALRKRLETVTGSAIDRTDNLTDAMVDMAQAEAMNSVTGGNLVYAMGQFIEQAQYGQTEAGQLETELRENEAAQKALQDQVDAGKKSLEDYNEEIVEAEEKLASYQEETADTAIVQQRVTMKVNESLIAIKDLEQSYHAAADAARESVDAQIGIFQELETKCEMTAKEIIDNWTTQQQAFEAYADNLKKAVDMGLDQALVQQLANGTEQSMIYLNELINSTKVSVDEINAAWAGLSKGKDDAASAMGIVAAGIEAEIDKLAGSSVSWGMEVVNGLIKGAKEKARSWNKTMSQLGEDGLRSFKAELRIESPSREMREGGIDTVDGAVIGVDERKAAFEKSMKELAAAGIVAFANNHMDKTQLYSGYLTVPDINAGQPSIQHHHHGDYIFQITQLPGEDEESLANRVMDLMQTRVARQEAVFGA